MDPRLTSFEQSFRAGISTCRMQCDCGKTWYDGSDHLASWDEGEREALAADPNAHGVDYSIGIITFERKEYADACDCWHARAKQIIAFIEDHRNSIAKYFDHEKKRLESEAAAVPVIAT